MLSFEERIAKLPEWARNHINNLRHEKQRALDDLQRAIYEGDTNVCVHSYGVRPDIKLPPDSMIRFTVGKDARGHEVQMDVVVDRITRLLEVRVSGDLLHAISIIPGCTNSIQLDAINLTDVHRKARERESNSESSGR